ncbi:unnamed protein product [Didymodactylos carnosus]|uniref:Uncharacterized protein n=1 Tax=Didymodactylos carnosus TaxID=1234261 RepID=A0A815IFU5_9BILA|nr:unnamed protein product [Didymodactylos carnosus]CAF1453087.1 unnamed protein product [Didymodactylos carnosus]CAF4246467.1 unnamed protein product [Didymodactylos carnosus]CAF4247486.1 unnamed protein product [Didymodactylos carnosus]
MIWPADLVTCSFFRALHETKEEDLENNFSRWKMSWFKLFCIVSGCSFCYYWFPGYIFPLLSAFSFICIMKPKSVIFSQITGVSGFGLGTVQFDWNSLTSFLHSPIIVPGWAHVNILVGFIIIGWILSPLLYYTNSWDGKKFPVGTPDIYRPDDTLYDVSFVLDEQSRLNQTAYETYGHIRLTILYAVTYGPFFAILTACIMHITLYHGKEIIRQLNTSLAESTNDIHAKLMLRYPEAPEWWYSVLFIANVVVTCLICHFGQLMP